MSNDRDHYELIIQYLDGKLSTEELTSLELILQEDPNACNILAEVAEQAIMLADSRRATNQDSTAIPKHADTNHERLATNLSFLLSMLTHSRITATLSIIAACVLVVWLSLTGFVDSSPQVEVIELTGVTHYYNAKSMSENRLQLGSRLQTGDLIESRSCDAWISLQIARATTLTIAGHSSIRVILSNPKELRLELLQGSIWFSPAKTLSERQFTVSTPTMNVRFRNSMLNIQTSPSESIVRVDQGEALVQSLKNENAIAVIPKHQCYVSIHSDAPLESIRQPVPVEKWASSQMKDPEVLRRGSPRRLCT